MRGRAWAALVSLAIHGTLILVIFRTSPPPATSPPALEPIAIDLVQPESVEPAPVQPVGPPAPRPPPPRRPRERQSSVSAAPRAPRQPQPPTEPAEGPQQFSGLRMRGPNLTLDDATLDRYSRDGYRASHRGSTRGYCAGPGPAKGMGKSKWQQKLALLEREDSGRKNVADGKVHPQVYDFMRDAERVFAPRESVVAEDSRAPNTLGRSVRAWTRGFARDYIETLRQQAAAEPPRKSAFSDHGSGSDLFEGYNQVLRAAEKVRRPSPARSVWCCAPASRPRWWWPTARETRRLDDAAVEALRKASLRRPLDGQLVAQRACYRFAANVHRVPPLPMVGCGFDESRMTASCFYPGKQMYQLKVTLELVDYGG